MVQRAPWQPVTKVPNSDNVVFFFFFLTQHFGLRGCQEHHYMLVENFSFSKEASSTSCTKKIPQKLARADFGRKEEWFSRKCWQLVDQDVQWSFWRPSCHTSLSKWKVVGHFISRWLSARSHKCGISEREWGSTAVTPSWNLWLFKRRLKVRSLQATVQEKRWWRNWKLPTNLALQLLASLVIQTTRCSLADYEEGDIYLFIYYNSRRFPITANVHVKD